MADQMSCHNWGSTDKPIVVNIEDSQSCPMKTDPDEPPLTPAQMQCIDTVLECATEVLSSLERLTVSLKNAAKCLPSQTFL